MNYFHSSTHWYNRPEYHLYTIVHQRTQSGVELPWQVPTIEAPGLRCKSISKPNLRWNKLGHPRISKSNTLLCRINIGQLGTVSGSLHKHKLLQSIMIKKILPAIVDWWLLLSSLQRTLSVCHSCGKLERERNRGHLHVSLLSLCQLHDCLCWGWFWVWDWN